MARWYGSTTERALNGKHAADLKRLKAALRDGEPCWRCGQPMYSWQKLERDHIIDRSLGGADGPAVLAHASCNRSAGATLGNQMHGFKPAAAGQDVICRTCGKPYHYTARGCEICGLHYHPSYAEQRTCGRSCGRELVQRNRRAAGWVPKAERPKPPPKPRSTPEAYAPRSSVMYYTCRYCGRRGAAPAKGQLREVCPARACQLARLRANHLRVRSGLSKDAADAAMVGVVAADALMPSRPRRCGACGEPTNHFRWCDACRCGSANAKGYRCGNRASVGPLCDYHASETMTPSRAW